MEHWQSVVPLRLPPRSAVAVPLLFLILARPLSAQIADFSSLASDSLGNLYLNSSLVLRVVKPALAGNIFQYTSASGWEWFSPSWGPANGSVDVSSAGDVIAITDVQEQMQCVGSNCQIVPVPSAQLVAPSYSLNSFAGYIQISHNGRYAVLSVGNSDTLLDITTGLSTSFSGQLSAPKEAITDSGCTLLNTPLSKNLVLHCPSGDSDFAAIELPYTAKVDGTGTRIVYSCNASQPMTPGATWDLHLIDVSSGQDSLLTEEFPLTSSSEQGFWISADGSQIAYLAPPSLGAPNEVFAIGGDGSGRRQLTTAEAYPEGFLETTISPDAARSYAISQWNRVVQIDIASDQVTEIIPRTPVVSGYGYGVNGMVPGSMAIFWGTALSDGVASASEPMPYLLAGASVKVNGMDAPIISAQPDALRFQIPYEASGGAVITLPSTSPFEQYSTPPGYPLVPWDLAFLDLSPDPAIYLGISAIHQDFSSLVTLDNPAQPNEIVNFYAVGMGPTNPSVPTGMPAPSNPPAIVVNPLQCSIGNPDGSYAPVAVRFAGLAPGMSGIYQVSIQLPGSFSLLPGERYIVIFCTVSGGAFVPGVQVAVPNSN